MLKRERLLQLPAAHDALTAKLIARSSFGNDPDRDAKMQALAADTPLKRFGMPEEVATIAVMMASDEAIYITGTEVNIDGGLLAALRLHPAKRAGRRGETCPPPFRETNR